MTQASYSAARQPPPHRTDRRHHGELLHGCHRRLVRLVGFGFCIAAVCNLGVLLVPLYTMELYDTVLSTRNLDTLLWLSIGLGIALCVYGALEYCRSLLYDAMAASLGRDLGLATLLAAAQSQGDRGRAMEALRDLGEVRGFISGGAISAPLDLVWSPVFLIALFVLHWSFGAYALVCAAALMLLNLLADGLTKRPLEDANEEKIRAFGEIAVAVRGAETVEGLGMVPALARRWQRSQHTMLDKLWRGTRVARMIGSTVKSCRFMMSGGVVCLGVTLTFDGSVTPGTLIAASIMLTRLLAPFEQLTASWHAWVSARAAWRRVKQVLLETKPARGTIPLPCPEGRLTIDRLVYIPQGSQRPVLRGITFEVAAGEVLGVIGPSGAGKTSLARLVVGINEPTAGGVWLDGNSTWLWERGDFGRHIGYMPQTTALLEGTVAQNIARLRDGDLAEVVEAAVRAGVHDAIMKLPHGYATRLGDSGFLLSGGQRQRLALARALYGRPRLLVLDEPNSNLDAEGEAILLDAIRQARDEGTTVLMIAHRPSLMAAADKLLVLNEGVIERFGPRDSVLRAVQSPSIQLIRSTGKAAVPARAAS